MALEPLATAADLDARRVDLTGVNSTEVDAVLLEASDEVRDAAGCPISQLTSTINVVGGCGQWLALPGSVASVSAVQHDSADVTGWTLADGRLWRAAGWLLATTGPTLVTVTIVHGLATVPEDIVGVVCRLAAELLAAHEAGLGDTTRLTSLSFGDYREGYTDPSEVMAPLGRLSDVERARIAARFGGGAVVVGTYS